MRAAEGVVQEMASPSVVQWAGGHDYKTNVAFNCMATSGWCTTSLQSAIAAVLKLKVTANHTSSSPASSPLQCLISCQCSAIGVSTPSTELFLAGQGYVVIGSDDGQIRMYSEKSLTRANTAIPGLGGPITAVDVTYDGKWVLATTKNYLMVVKTTYKVCLASAMLPSHVFRDLTYTCTCPACSSA